MKHWRQQITIKLQAAIISIEQFFLGPKFKSDLARAPIVLLVGKADEESYDLLKKLMITNTYENIVLMTGRIDYPKIPDALLLKPQNLEDVPAMVLAILRLKPRLLVLDHLSAMPNMPGKLMEVFLGLKLKYPGLLVILEHEYSLGQKNSALLGRMMNT